jgi:5-methylcytosine-specific restriction protein A
MRIPDEASVAAYDVAKRVYEGSLARETGLSSLTSAHSMNPSSAADYLGIFSCMVEGRRYTRTNNAFATDYYLTQIHKDYGADGLRNALTALSLHLEYYEGLRQTTLRKIRSIQAKHAALLEYESLTVFPDEVPDTGSLAEGTVTEATVNVYERNPVARQKCIDRYGCTCFVCNFDFEAEYGTLGRSFIHVHHLIELSTIRGEYTVDPIKDLRPLCPNCHAMIHRKRPAFSIDELCKHLTTGSRRSPRLRRGRG